MVSQKDPEYVLVFCARRIPAPSILIIHKDRPQWQAGRINLPGGRIEAGETPEQAAIRELNEETGLQAKHAIIIGDIDSGRFKIHVVEVFLEDEWQPLVPRSQETEIPEWTLLPKLLIDNRVLPNLRLIIPLALSGIKNWSLLDTYNSSTQSKQHTMSITMQTKFEG